MRRATELALDVQLPDPESGEDEGEKTAVAATELLEVMDRMPMPVEGDSTRMEVAVAVVVAVVAVVEGDSSATRKEFRQLPQLWQHPSHLPMWAYSQRLTPI